MSFEQNIKDAMLLLLKERNVDAVQVTDFYEDYSEGYGGCDTCGSYPEWSVDIFYTNSQGQGLYYTYDGRFTSLLRDLDRLS